MEDKLLPGIHSAKCAITFYNYQPYTKVLSNNYRSKVISSEVRLEN